MAKGDQGRAILLPLQWLKNDQIVNAPSVDGFIGKANELVKFDNQYLPVVRSLLGNTIVVDHQENAIKALSTLPSQARIVTLNGEVFRGNGIVFAGKETRSAMIARPRQKQELLNLIEETQEKFTTIDADINRLETDFQKLDQDHIKISQDDQKGNLALQQNQKLVNQQNLDFEKLKQRKQWVRESNKNF